MASINICGTRLEYLEAGSGEALVFVHGSASDYRTWELQLQEFGKRFRVVAYSRRYHWPNKPMSEQHDYSMNEHLDDLQALLHAFNAGPVHLVGHSYGAFLCLLLAIREPQLARTLILAEPPVVTLFVSNAPKPWEILKLLARQPRTAAAILKFGVKGVAPASKAFRSGDSNKAIGLFGDAVLGAGGYGRLPDSRKAQVHDNITNVKAELLGSGFPPLDSEQVRSVQIPTLLVTGERSIGLFHRLTDRLEELLPNSDRVEIPAASHMMHEDNANAYNTAILSFLTTHDQAA